MRVFCVHVQVSTFISAVHLANTVRLLHLAVTICIVALKVLSGHIMKGRIHWTNIASILVCLLIFESPDPNYVNLEQLKVFKGIETVWSWPICCHFLSPKGFSGRIPFPLHLLWLSGEVKSSSLMSNRGALCCFPFWIDKKSYSYMYSYILFVVCAGQFRRRDCSSEQAILMFHSPCWGWR